MVQNRFTQRIRTGVLAIFLTIGFAFPLGVYAATILGVGGGGTGIGLPGGFVAGTIPFGNGLQKLATSSAFMFNNAGSRLTVTNASTTALSASVFCLSTDCKTAWPSAGAGAWPFTSSAYNGVANQSTTTPLWLKNTMIIASSTYFTTASSTLGTIDTAWFTNATALTAFLPDTPGGASVGTNGLGFSSLWLDDTASVYELAIQSASGMAGDQTLTFNTGNYSPTVTFDGANGYPTLADWFNQSVKTTAYPSFAGASTTLFTNSGNAWLIGSTTIGAQLNLQQASSTNFTASGTVYASTGFFGTASTTNLWISGLGTPAGTFLAVNPQGQVIATTTPASGAAGLGYVLSLHSNNTGSPSNATTYYFGADATWHSHTASKAVTRMYVPKAGTIKSVYGGFYVGAPGSAETFTLNLRLNDTSNTAITTTASTSLASNYFQNTGLSVAVVAGDFIDLVATTPSWVTGPTGGQLNAFIYIE